MSDQALPEEIGPWRIWFDPPPIGTRDCDWHYQHEDADDESPGWTHGSCASREECIAEIINGYEDRASDQLRRIMSRVQYKTRRSIQQEEER